MYDVCIIGAGVIGCAIARELSKYNLDICILEKEEDVSCGASKANSGIVHGGYAAKHGTLKGRLNAIGNRMFRKLEEELNFGFRETGALVIGFTDSDYEELQKLYENGVKNETLGMKIIGQERIREIEPHIHPDVKWALYCSTVGITSPYELTIALAENSIANGVTLKLSAAVKDIVMEKDFFQVFTMEETIKSRYVVNAAGAYSDRIASMVSLNDFRILPRRGQYILLDKSQGHLANTVIFQVPTKLGKGILVTPTYHGNLMLGPNAEEVEWREDVGTTEEVIRYIVETARQSIPDFDMTKALTSFSGIRATSDRGDFIIEESKVPGFINVAGIESPGLTASPAIALLVVDILKKAGLSFTENSKFNPYRKPIIQKKRADFSGKVDALNPEENIICRCEQVTEAEIVDAIRREIPIKSMDAIKRRVRSGMGLCQGSFCGPRVRSIIARETGLSQEEIIPRGKGSSILPPRAERIFFTKLNQNKD
ncbi:MAG: NAD(P)/FAD-dependent oxidoreductase [Thermotaleaceae bacterium]